VPLQVALAQAEVKGGRAAQGVPRLHDLAESRPADVVVIGAYAQVLVDTGQADKAYNLVKRSMARVPDPRLAAAFVMVSVAAGHREEAATFLESLAAQSGSESLRQKAAALRAGGSP
jgi:predicted Zn-dependent protease